MPKLHHHKKHGHKGARRAHAAAHDHPAKHAKHAHRTRHHRKEAKHEYSGSLPNALRKKLERPVTVKTLQDIVALRRVQRGG